MENKGPMAHPGIEVQAQKGVERIPLLPGGQPTQFGVEETMRLTLARWVLYGYLGLLVLQIVGPLILLGVVWNIPSANTDIIRDTKDLILGLSAAVAGLGGLAGVAVGYYFK